MRTRTCRWFAALGALVVLVVGATACTPPGQTNTTYGGYRASVGSAKTVSAAFKLTAVTCTSQTTGASPSVALSGSDGRFLHTAGIIYFCSGGSLLYYAEARVNGTSNLVQKSASAGDTVNVSLKTTGSTTVSTVKDVTKNWTVTQSGSVGTINTAFISTQIVGNGSTNYPLAHFGPTVFTAVTVSGKALGQASPVEVTMVDSGKVVRVQPSALSGGNSFTNTWKHA